MHVISLSYTKMIAAIASALLLIHSGESCAQVHFSGKAAMAAGGHFSSGGTGIALEILTKEGSALHTVRILADLDGVMTGTRDIPGAKGEYILSYILKSAVSSKGYSYRITAGPGLMGGYVVDRGKEYGPVFGICGSLGLDLLLEKNVNVSFGITTELGGHLDYRNRYNSTLTFYKNGIVNTIYPSVSVKYRFR